VTTGLGEGTYESSINKVGRRCIMAKTSSKVIQRRKRHLRVRRKVEGTPERPRLSVHKSLRHITAQVIDDWSHHTLVAASTLEPEVAQEAGGACNIAAARAVGLAIGKRAVDAGITKVAFDRGGWPVHGKLAALADAAREAGLDF
jgi:large subunit ribosomal protein L18